MRPLTAILLTIALVGVIGASFMLFLPRTAAPVGGTGGISVPLDLPGAAGEPVLVRRNDGSHVYLIRQSDGSTEELGAEAFAARMYDARTSGSWWSRLFNISSPLGLAWVTVGLLGQLLFTGRMLVQWFASERAKRSVVPTAFWWMSLGGASMLLLYFAWRRDVIGVLGQGTGWIVYIRNLWLIYRSRERQAQSVRTADDSPGVAHEHEPVVH